MSIREILKGHWPAIIIALGVSVAGLDKIVSHDAAPTPPLPAGIPISAEWEPPSLYTDRVLQGDERARVIYGEDLIANTARYLGPKGSVAAISNGMNCQNCHLMAGRQYQGNNYGAVYSTYPRFRDRSGSMESIYKRVSDCFERSLNGKAPDSNSREYQAIEAYIKWLGKDVKKGEKPKGSGITKLSYLERAADPAKGKEVYLSKCTSCHGATGEGVPDPAGTHYQYPPLWGEHSYNTGAGLYRISNFAGYVYSNMPYNQATHVKPVLTEAESWDLAAFVNSQPRPGFDNSKDWPDISKKPIDHPYGPYTDGFSEKQHKYGPYKPILEKRQQAVAKK